MNRRVEAVSARADVCVSGQVRLALGFRMQGDRLSQSLTQANAVYLADATGFVGIAMHGVVLKAALPVMQTEFSVQ